MNSYLIRILYSKTQALAVLLCSGLCFSSAIADELKDIPSHIVEKQLLDLQANVEAYRIEHNIPGLALAIIKDDKVVLSKGFGYARLGPDQRVTERTNFIIGSSTKSFSSVLASMLVEEGLTSWDTPAVDLLPELDLKIRSKTKNEQASLEDLLSHRSGFPRMSMLWVTPKLDPKTIFEKASNANPISPFRKAFNYNNLLYAAGAKAAAKAAESDWDALIKKRIFKPLKMKHSYSSVVVGKNDAHFAHGYRWIEDSQQHKKTLLFEGVDNVAPAGAISSNLTDMSKWIRFLLAEGKAGRKQLVATSSLEDVWTPRIKLSPDMGYGIGWFVESWQGQRVVHHGGNIQGYACQVALMPEKKLGLVLMANVTMTPLQSQIVPMVFESLLTEIPAEVEKADAPKNDYAPLVGHYVANFGPFPNTTFTVKDNEGTLAINVPGQRLYNLNAPAPDGKWYFEMTDKVAISFDQSDAGAATGIKMYQAGKTFELPRKSDATEDEVILSREDLRALMNHDAQLEAFSKIGGLEITGKINLPNTGIEGALKIYLSPKHQQIRVDMDFREFGNITTVYQDGKGEMRPNFSEAQAMSPQMIDELIVEQGFVNLFNTFSDIRVLKKETFKDQPVYEVQFSDPDQTSFKTLIHQETGQVLRYRANRMLDPQMPSMPIQIAYYDYEDIQGYSLPRRSVVSDNQNGNKIMLSETVKVVDQLDPSLFTLELP